MGSSYAPDGLLGVLTPQANTTVEPEFALLLPPRVGMLTARLVSACRTLEERLLEYFARLDETLDTYAQAPLDAVAVACTGPSYLIGPAAEESLVEGLRQRRGLPVITAAQALVAALRALNARRIALVSPYPAALTQASLGYWATHGFEVVRVQAVAPAQGGHHPIYGIETDAVSLALGRLRPGSGSPTAAQAQVAADAVLLLGTGLPTLPALAALVGPAQPSDTRHPGHPGRTGHQPPVLSSNLALAWLALEALQGRGSAPSGAALNALIRGDAGSGWRARLEGPRPGPPSV